MSREPDFVPPVLEEVRQRRVGKVVAAYLALTFAVIEVATYVLPGLDAPDWVFRTVLGVLVLGFPATVVLAWTYDITPSGVVRTPDDLRDLPEDPTSNAWLVVTLLGVALGVGVHMLR